MKQQKRDILQGLRVRTFSDILGTPDHRHRQAPEHKQALPEIKSDEAFVTFVDGDK